MAATYQLQIVSLEKIVYQGEIESLIAPGVLGYLGVLAHHAPLLTTLTKGKISIRESDGKEKLFRVDGGILEVANNRAVILTEKIDI